jgi:hypothetical protein
MSFKTVKLKYKPYKTLFKIQQLFHVNTDTSATAFGSADKYESQTRTP